MGCQEWTTCTQVARSLGQYTGHGRHQVTNHWVTDSRSDCVRNGMKVGGNVRSAYRWGRVMMPRLYVGEGSGDVLCCLTVSVSGQ